MIQFVLAAPASGSGKTTLTCALLAALKGTAYRPEAVRPVLEASPVAELFGAITGKEISEALLSQFGLDVGKQKIVLDEPIKAFGSYEVKAKLGYEVSAKFSVSVAEE